MIFFLVDRPAVLALGCLVLMLIAEAIGRRAGKTEFGPDAVKVLDALRGAALTVLAVILGFSLSMAVARYDQRRAAEAVEGNSVGTEYSRLAILPADDAKSAREKLAQYAKLRIDFYQTTETEKLAEIERATHDVQQSLLADLYAFAARQPTPIAALAVSGMNSVVNSRGMTGEAWDNRMPLEVWGMLIVFGVAASFLMCVGFSSRQAPLVWLTPATIAVVLFLIADIESPAPRPRARQPLQPHPCDRMSD